MTSWWKRTIPGAAASQVKRVLQFGFYSGELTISARTGMVKTYELMDRHFGWPPRPRAATDRQIDEYLLERALTSQGLISGPSVMRPRLRFTPELQKLIETRVRTKKLVAGDGRGRPCRALRRPRGAGDADAQGPPLVHILSPFDPLVIQRRRLSLFFGYDHVFEAYVKKEKRQFGYFTLPVLVGDEVVAADGSEDRPRRRQGADPGLATGWARARLPSTRRRSRKSWAASSASSSPMAKPELVEPVARRFVQRHEIDDVAVRLADDLDLGRIAPASAPLKRRRLARQKRRDARLASPRVARAKRGNPPAEAELDFAALLAREASLPIPLIYRRKG